LDHLGEKVGSEDITRSGSAGDINSESVAHYEQLLRVHNENIQRIQNSVFQTIQRGQELGQVSFPIRVYYKMQFEPLDVQLAP